MVRLPTTAHSARIPVPCVAAHHLPGTHSLLPQPQRCVTNDFGPRRRYAFLARPEGSEASEPKPEGVSKYLQNLFTGWSPEIHDILQATQDYEIEQRDLYDRYASCPSAIVPRVISRQWIPQGRKCSQKSGSAACSSLRAEQEWRVCSRHVSGLQ